jgi:hypothetical protein
MKHDHYFYNCSKEYIDAIDLTLYKEITEVISKLPKRQTQTEINNDLFWLLTSRGWSFDSLSGVSDASPREIKTKNTSKAEIKVNNDRTLCKTSTTLDASWHCDFAKSYDSRLVQIEAQFGKVESMFKDFCGFRIARSEKRLTLGIEIVLCEPSKYFAHRRKSIGGMAYFDIAKNTLPAIGLECPIWLIGIRE